MTLPRRLPLALTVLLAVLIAGLGAYAAVGLTVTRDATDEAASATEVIQSPAAAAPAAAVRPAAAPARGVSVLPGPFTDRVRFDRLRLSAADNRSTVSGALVVTSDVSEVIVAEVVVTFYGEDGQLLATRTAVLPEGGQKLGDGSHEQEHGEHGDSVASATRTEADPEPFRVKGPAGAVAATVALPALVNE